MIKTVLGNIPDDSLGITLSHEHICNYNEYLRIMAGDKYLDEKMLIATAVKYLKYLKNEYNLSSIIDCSAINIGRDIEILKQVSEKSGINIICSTGFYYTNEPVMANMSAESIAKIMVIDSGKINAGVIKCCVESAEISGFPKKLLYAAAKAHAETGLPIVMHTNANNQNGLKALEILIDCGVKPEAVTVGHLSDTENLDYIQKIASLGCYIGYDRLYEDCSIEYVEEKLNAINTLIGGGYEKQILLSHDATFFTGFDAIPQIIEKPRFSYCFEYILPRLEKDTALSIMTENVKKFLKTE